MRMLGLREVVASRGVRKGRGAPGRETRRRATRVERFEADFLQRVKARRREPPGWMLRRDDSDGDDSEGSPVGWIPSAA